MIFPLPVDAQVIFREALLDESQPRQQAAAALVAGHVVGHEPVQIQFPEGEGD